MAILQATAARAALTLKVQPPSHQGGALEDYLVYYPLSQLTLPLAVMSIQQVVVLWKVAAHCVADLFSALVEQRGLFEPGEQGRRPLDCQKVTVSGLCLGLRWARSIPEAAWSTCAVPAVTLPFKCAADHAQVCPGRSAFLATCGCNRCCRHYR